VGGPQLRGIELGEGSLRRWNSTAASKLPKPSRPWPAGDGGGRGQLDFPQPGRIRSAAGREFRVAVNLRSDQDLSAASVSLSFDPRIMTLKDVSEGGISRQFGSGAPFLKNIDNNSGSCTIGFSSPQMGKGAKGGGTLALLLFEAKAAGEG